MDLIIYLLVLCSVAYFRMKAPSDAVSPILNEPGAQTAEVYTLPVGRNLQLLKEKDAYTLILEELGLK